MGRLLSASSDTRISRIRSQLAFADDPMRGLAWGQEVVRAKISKQVTVLQRFGRLEHVESTQETMAQLKTLIGMLPDCGTSGEQVGIEGAAAARYWPAYGGLCPEPLRFEIRSKQPPLDVVNSALSYLYSGLVGEVVSALWASGLDPAIAVLHADKDWRPSLDLDLMEEFRTYVVDQVVLEASRRGQLTLDSGWSEPGVPESC